MTTTNTILARILFFFYLVAVACLCFMHFESVPNIQKTILGFPTDKVVHFIMFLPFPILAYLSYDHRTETFWKAFLYAAITFCIGCGLAFLTEFGQKFLPYRSMDMNDMKADSLALAISSILVFIIDITHLHKNK